MLEVLAALGFTPMIRYRKDSRIFEYKGALVSVDRLNGLGSFCEIEVADLERDLDAVVSALGLDPDKYEPRGYPALANEAAKTKA